MNDGRKCHRAEDMRTIIVVREVVRRPNILAAYR